MSLLKYHTWGSRAAWYVVEWVHDCRCCENDCPTHNTCHGDVPAEYRRVLINDTYAINGRTVYGGHVFIRKSAPKRLGPWKRNPKCEASLGGCKCRFPSALAPEITRQRPTP